jgi:hypothetical protein
MPVANLVKRRLDETFRQLYGEITDPAERHARTMEVQGELLAQHVMFATMFKEGNNRWWSGPGGGRFNQYLGESEGRVTDKDRKIYGKMAGKYVTKEVYDLLHGTGALARGMSMKGIGPWFQELQGIVRGTRLLWYKTILRNGLTSVTGFAFRSGDALHTPYWKHLKDGIKLAGQILNQIRREGSYEGLSLREGTFEELDAWDKLAHLVETDIFDSSHQSMLMAVAENLEAAQGFDVAGREKAIGPLRRSLRRAMEAYSIIDLPAKYASYMNAITPKDEGGLGLSHEEAVEHVRKFYQYRDRAPEGIKRINRWWLGDYFGYTYDSGRITVNELKNVYEQARKGNIKPLLGFMIGSGLPLFRIGMGSWTSLAIGNSLTAALKAWYDDDDEEEFIRGATEEEAAVLRHYVPGYDMFSPLALWYVRNKKTGEEGVHWDVMAGQSAFPLEDAVIGTIQTWRQLKAAGMPQEFGQILLANLSRILPLTPGMTLEEVILKPLFGYDISTGESSGRAGVLEVLVDAKEAIELGKPFRPGIYDAMIGDDLRGAIPTMIANSIMPGQSGKVVQSTLGYLKDNRPPRIGSGKYRYVDEPGDIWNMVASLQRSYTLWPDQMMSMLDNSIRYDLKSLGQAKYMAGAVERDQLQYHGPTPPSIVERAERGKDHWYISLKSIEREVKNFKKFSRNQFTDEQLTDYIRGIAGERGALRRYEAEAVVKGTVDSLGYEQEDAFKTEPTPKPAQKGESFAIAYLKEHRGSADYDELRRAMIARGYIIPEGRRFTLWMRDLRRQMAQEEYDLPPRRRR